jgi:HD-GYP domain-containing protein (c-di-GMP phosphodiesterase class II)
MTTMTDTPADAAADAGAQAPQAPVRAVGLLVGIELNDATLGRIRDSGIFDVSDDTSQLRSAKIVALSTRAGRGQVPRIPSEVDPEETPVVVICHPGGEESAATLMQQGCAGVVAEGNEPALGSFLDPDRYTDVLVEGYREQHDKGSGGAAARNRDPITSLPEIASFEMRLSELAEAGTPPNVLMMQITNLERARERSDNRAVNLLRRRLASFYSDAARRHSCEVFSLSESMFAVLDGSQLLLDPEGFAKELIQITEAFRPAGIKLQLAIGAVISSAESDVMAIRDQAQQAVLAASQAGESAYVTADQVTVLLASATEYNVAQLLVSLVEQNSPNPPGHGSRVADLAADMASEVGYQGRDLSNLRLAALLHDLGRIALNEEAPVTDESVPERGARYVLASAGPEIADAIRYQAERWDGAGPSTLIEDDIPLAARIIAIAKAADTWLHPPEGEQAVAPADMIEKIKADSGTRFDPGLAETAVRLFGGS